MNVFTFKRLNAVTPKIGADRFDFSEPLNNLVEAHHLSIGNFDPGTPIAKKAKKQASRHISTSLGDHPLRHSKACVYGLILGLLAGASVFGCLSDLPD